MTSFLSQFTKDRSLPEHVYADNPEFVAFLDAYYDWLSETKNAGDIVKNFASYHDIDTTLDEFVTYFSKEIMNGLPISIAANKRLLAKHIKEFYLNKGNEASYRFLFRALYNEDVEFYYPKVDILRASDGKWVENTIIKISLSSVDQGSLFLERTITGQTSGTTAGVESIVTYIERGQLIGEIIISNIKGTGFINGENILVNDGTTNSGFVLLSMYSMVNLTNSGSGYSVGEIIPVKDSLGNIVGTASVSRVTTGPILSLSIDSAGVNYNGNIKIINFFSGLPINYTFSGHYLPTTGINVYQTYAINQPIAAQNVAGVGDKITIKDVDNSSGYGANGVVQTVGDYGQILSVVLNSGGNLYQNPEATIETTTGTFGAIGVIGGGGGISKMKLNSFPIKLENDTNNTLSIDFSNYGDGNANGTLSVANIATYPGKYINEDGHLSSIKKLEDNKFYQDFSYVLQVGRSIDQWSKVVKELVHPAGLEVFGQINLTSEIVLTTEEYSEMYLLIESEYQSIIEEFEYSSTKLFYIDAGEFSIDFNDDFYSHVGEQPILDSNGIQLYPD